MAREYECSSILPPPPVDDGIGVVAALYKFWVKPVLRRLGERWRMRQFGPVKVEGHVSDDGDGDDGMRGGEGGESIRVLRSIRSSRGAPRNTVLFLFEGTGTELGVCSDGTVWRGDGRLGLRLFRMELDWSIIGLLVSLGEGCVRTRSGDAIDFKRGAQPRPDQYRHTAILGHPNWARHSREG